MTSQSILAPLLLTFSALAAEQAPQQPQLQGQGVLHWIKELGSDEFGRRERATDVLCAGDAKIIPYLKTELAQADDVEVKRRLQQVLAVVDEIAFDGKFFQHEVDITDENGQRMQLTNSQASGSVELSAGKLVWTQKYDGQTVTQSYSFDPKESLSVKGTRQIALKFDKMDSSDEAYLADSINPKLEVKNSRAGAQIVLITTDGQGMNNKVLFAREERRAGQPQEPGVEDGQEVDDLEDIEEIEIEEMEDLVDVDQEGEGEGDDEVEAEDADGELDAEDAEGEVDPEDAPDELDAENGLEEL